MNATFRSYKLILLTCVLVAATHVGCRGKKSTYESSNTEASFVEHTTPGIPNENVSAGPVENIEASERLEAIRLRPVEDPFEVEAAIFRAEIRGAFEQKNFHLLETKVVKLRESKELFGGGRPKLAAFYEGINERINHEVSDYKRDLGIFQEWDKAKPKSLALRIALIGYYSELAWNERGNGYSDTITASMRKGFDEKLSIAAAILAEARALPEKDPCCQYVGIQVALGQGWAAKDFDQLVAEAVAQDPTFYLIDEQRAYSLHEKWYGKNKREWSEYAKKAAARPGGLGDEAYARIVISSSSDFSDVFRDGGADKKMTLNGMAILRKKYPDSLFILNQTACLATMARDRKLAEACFTEIGDNVLPSVWPKKERFVHFRGWAMTGKW